jgi:hypothetical protein
VLIEMFRRLAKNPNENKQTNNAGIVDAVPMLSNAILYSIAESITTLLLFNIPTSHPAKGSETKKPTGNAKSIAPNAEALRFKFC